MAGAILVGRAPAVRDTRELDTERAAWAVEKADLGAALAKARARRSESLPMTGPAETTTVLAKPDPQELLNQLVSLQVVSGPGQGRQLRQTLALLEQLRQGGPEALPAIRQFLASGRDVAYDAFGGRGSRDVRALAEALVPFSLRFALFDVVHQIGGAEAESVLAESLGQAARGLELAYLTELLERMTPGKYRDAALAAANALLARSATGPERDLLFGILRRFNDTSCVATAQAQLVQPDGKIDRSSLRYLQQTLGEPTVALATQLYQSGRVTEADSKEPLARVALTYVGANPQAAELFHTAVLDQTLKPDQRRELVEDLNQDGLSNTRNPTPEDLKIVANRYALTQAYLQQDYVQDDKVLNAAFREADKDLRNMLQRAATAATPPANQPAQPKP